MRVGGREVDHGGEQQGLGAHAGCGVEVLAAQGLVGEAFVGGVLVDQDEAVIGGGGEDVGVEHLGDRRAERVVGQGDAVALAGVGWVGGTVGGVGVVRVGVVRVGVLTE